MVGRTLEQSRIELIEDWEDELWQKHKREFEIKRNVELMKTQRMDKEYKRITEEQERRGLQRVIHYEQKNTTHKKLYSRVMSKSLLKDLGLTSVKVLTDLKVLDENKEPILRQKVIPWLSNQSNNNLISQCYISQALDRMLENPTETLLRKHGFFLNRERARLKKIEDDRIKAEEDFQEARKQRRERRR